MDFTKVQLSSSASSNKILKEGTGSFDVAALPGAGETFSTATVSHGYGSDNLIWQVSAHSDTAGALMDLHVLPWSSSDNRLILYATIDNKNLYITCISSDSGGGGAPARTIKYDYKILIP